MQIADMRVVDPDQSVIHFCAVVRNLDSIGFHSHSHCRPRLPGYNSANTSCCSIDNGCSPVRHLRLAGAEASTHTCSLTHILLASEYNHRTHSTLSIAPILPPDFLAAALDQASLCWHDQCTNTTPRQFGHLWPVIGYHVSVLPRVATCLSLSVRHHLFDEDF